MRVDVGERACHSAEVYWLPRSLWTVSPGAGCLAVVAIDNASSTSEVRMCGRAAQPTTALLARSWITEPVKLGETKSSENY